MTRLPGLGFDNGFFWVLAFASASRPDITVLTRSISKWLLAGSWAMINILLLVLDSDSHVDLHATGL